MLPCRARHWCQCRIQCIIRVVPHKASPKKHTPWSGWKWGKVLHLGDVIHNIKPQLQHKATWKHCIEIVFFPPEQIGPLMFNKSRLVQRTTGITQVNSVSGWISAGLRQWAQHKGRIEISSAVHMYSLSFFFSTHYISMLLQNVQICISPGLPGVTFGKAPRGKASDRAAEKST